MKDNLPFGKRYGFESIEIPFQIKSINETLRTELWSAFYLFFYQPWEDKRYHEKKNIVNFYGFCWLHFFKRPYDEFPKYDAHKFAGLIKNHFLKKDWIKVYEYIEFIFENAKSENFDVDTFRKYVNHKLKNNNSAYTIIESKVVPITNEAEIGEINNLNDSLDNFEKLAGIGAHLKASLDFISNKETPDYRNSIKESISMVEVISRIIEPSENTLGKALNKLEKNNKINPIFKNALEKFYAYTNGKNGIRHAILDEETIGIEDARFFLISCSAFTNYLIEKAKKENLIK